jgi:Zn-dependent protease with chaperone function
MITTHPHEKPLFFLAVFAASIFWAGLGWLVVFLVLKIWPSLRPGDLVLVAVGATLVIALLHSLRQILKIATLRGYAVEISGSQFPDLHNRLHSVCKRLEIDPMPAAYINRDQHGPDAFSLKYLGRGYLVLNANLVNALTERQGAIDFVMGHELGRLYHRYRNWDAYLWPIRVLPLLGPAYARTQVYVRDMHGLNACKTRADAAFALAMVAAGDRRWKSLSIPDFAAQSAHKRLFSMSYAELISAQPWLSKRMANLRAISTSSDHLVAQRNPFAYVAAMLTPYLGWRYRGMSVRVIIILLWILSLSHGIWAGERLLIQHGLLSNGLFSDQLNKLKLSSRSQGDSEARNLTRGELPVTKLSPHDNSSNDSEAGVQTKSNPYRKLEDDLRLLGRYARERQQRQGGIPCEIGNIKALSLNYPAERYAFSCDEPKVYTIVERGEFEPGKPSHIRTYNWKTRKFVLGPSAPPSATEDKPKN